MYGKENGKTWESELYAGVPEEDPLIGITVSYGRDQGNPSGQFAYTAGWDCPDFMKPDELYDIARLYASGLQEESITEGPEIFGLEIPFLQEEIGKRVEADEPVDHSIAMLEDSRMYLKVEGSDTEPLRHYFPRTVRKDAEEIDNLLGQAEDRIKDAKEELEHEI